MTVTSGFFNGIDRPASATDISAIFDGLISDGIYDTVGNAFSVTAAGDNYLNLGTGRAWFNHTWTRNDAIVVYEAPASELLLSRYDCMVLEVDHSDPVRNNRIFLLSGTPSSAPELPELSSGPTKFQYLLASVLREPNTTEILAENITPYQGSSQTPFVHGLIDKFDITDILNQYRNKSLELIDDLEMQILVLQQTGIPLHKGNHFVNGSDPISKRFTIIIPTNWVGSSAPYTQQISVDGMLSTMIGKPHIMYSNSDSLNTKIAQATAFGLINDIETNDGNIIITCFKEKPITQFTMVLEVIL